MKEYKVWNKEEIKYLIETNDKVLISSLLQVYNSQTIDEQCTKETAERNGVGFNASDAYILSSFAEWYKSHEYLSPKQIAIARKKMIKYSGQVTKLANQHELRKAGEYNLKHLMIRG